MPFQNILSNQVMIAALLAWFIAQVVKVPLEFFQTKRWNWVLLFRAGGMPSSHSALVAGAAHAIGLYSGFDSPIFALSFVVSMIVIYDATGIRRQAGKHAEIINQMITDLTTGHPLKEETLREVLGHTPMQAFMGTLLGLACAQIIWWIWPV
ncbi:MAG TPA: divergent PAP2 family protein [Anaerolineales bacterium]|nr:divergent PAP2 family protein [Anaerolineales bacterium]